MAERPWMPMYWGDYLADTFDLDTEEHGVYLLMIATAWRRIDAALPNDMKLIKRMVPSLGDMHGRRFNRIVPKILERFWVLESDGQWHQKRLEKERNIVKTRSKKASKSAAKRWHQSSGDNELGDANALPGQCTRARLPQPQPDSESESSLRVRESSGNHSGCGVDIAPTGRAPKQASDCAPPGGAPNGASDIPDLDAELFRRGRALLGKKSGGQIQKLKTAFGVGKALEILEIAKRKDSPTAYIAGALKRHEDETGYGRRTIGLGF